MPHTVTRNVKANELRKGDTFVDAQNVEHEVTDVERKTTYVYVTLAGLIRPMRVLPTDIATVKRVEATEEEKEAAKRQYMIKHLRDSLTHALRNTPRAALQAILDKDNDYAEVLSWSNLPGVLHAQAMYKQAVDIRATIHHLADQRGLAIDVNAADDVANVDDDVLLDAYAWWYERATERRDYVRDPLSRSTSPIGNILEDCDRWAVDKMLEDMRWLPVKEEMATRLARLHAEAKARQQ